MLQDGEQLPVTLTVNSGCPEMCPVRVTEPDGGDSCDIQADTTEKTDSWRHN